MIRIRKKSDSPNENELEKNMHDFKINAKTIKKPFLKDIKNNSSKEKALKINVKKWLNYNCFLK